MKKVWGYKMAKATYNGVVVAEANDEDTIRIEGGTYFPPSSLKKEYFEQTDKHTSCHWKGEATYFNLNVNGETGENLAWSYPEPIDGANDTVGKDFTDFVSFYPQVTVS